MQHDEVIWQVIRHNHCSFMAKITAGIFCRNPYNLTGICNRSSCPLANSRYATIRDHDGVFYLYMKTIERAHMPNKLWERVKLPRNYMQALGIISKYVEHWPKFLQHKIKQRLTKMTQMRIRMKKIKLKTRETIVPLPRKEKKREARREEKAEKAANLGKIIEDEVLHRLKEGVYPSDIINYPRKPFERILEEEIEDELAKEYVELEDEEEQDMEDAFTGFNVNTADADVGLDEGEEGDDDHDTEVVVHRKRGRKQSSFALKKAEQRGDKAKKKAKVVVEVERDDADERQVAAH